MQSISHVQRYCDALNRICLFIILIFFAFSVEGQKYTDKLPDNLRNTNAIDKSSIKRPSVNTSSYLIFSIKSILAFPFLLHKNTQKIIFELSLDSKDVLVDLDDFLPEESGNGVWSYLGNIPTNFTPNKNNEVDFKLAEVGTYTFRYTQITREETIVITDVQFKIIQPINSCSSAPCHGIWDGNN